MNDREKWRERVRDICASVQDMMMMIIHNSGEDICSFSKNALTILPVMGYTRCGTKLHLIILKKDRKAHISRSTLDKSDLICFGFMSY